MAFASMRDFAEKLAAVGELVTVGEPVKTELEIAALADLEMKKPGGGKALLVTRPVLPDGAVSGFPVLVNAFGSARRVALALGVDAVDEVAAKLALLLKAKPPGNFGEAWELLKQGAGALHARPRTVGGGPCQEVIRRPADRGAAGLAALPILQCWPADGGPFVTLPNVYTQDPDTGARNVGMYRMQVFDAWTTGLHWQVHKVGARHGKRYYEKGERMPVSVCLGGDPALTFAATAPLPDGLDEVMLAGYLRRKSVPLVKCATNDLLVPADSDFVIEGYVDPGELRDEGPFGDHTGFYTPVDRYPVLHVTCVTHRRDAVYPATVVGPPPMEDFYLGDASVRIFLPVIKMNFPEIVDLALPAEGVFHNLVIVSVNKQYPYQAFKIMNGLWGMGQMMFSKIIVVVDADVDVHDTSAVLFHVCANIDPQRDIIFTKGPCDSLDHAQSRANVGSHMGIDATRKLAGEGYAREWPAPCAHPADLVNKMRRLLDSAAGAGKLPSVRSRSGRDG
jgi:4-hydroxy-3-polyprenylbenzoate decarboxylase